jgi:hypothetical protein
MDRAEERAGPEDVGDQALMRGLDTAFPFVRPGLSLSEIGRRSCDRPHSIISLLLRVTALLCGAALTGANRGAQKSASIRMLDMVDAVGTSRQGIVTRRDETPKAAQASGAS